MLGNSGKVKIGGIDTGKTLDLIITHYKSPFSLGKPFFDMVGLQRNIDFNDVGVILVNLGAGPFVVEKGMKIAQLVVSPVAQAAVVEVSDVDTTDRGAGGFGSTGV